MGISRYTPPLGKDGYPQSPCAPSGQVPQSNSGWRSETPFFMHDTCVRCGMCAIWCPDGAISNSADGYPQIDKDWCKGCGICATECPKRAIEMRSGSI